MNGIETLRPPQLRGGLFLCESYMQKPKSNVGAKRCLSTIGRVMPESGDIEVKTSTIGARRRRVGTGTDGVKVKAGQRRAKKRGPEEKISPVMARILDHRERLRARFVADMGKTMSDWEMTKLLCSYALPPGKYQEKYKEAAEILLRRYKNLVTILAAPPASLVKNDGIGESIVILICIVHACCLKMEWENLE